MASLSFGSCYISTPAVTATVAATPTKALGTTTEMLLAEFALVGSNRIVYSGTTPRVFEVMFAGSVTKGGGGSTLSTYGLFKNGALIPGGNINRQIANASDEGAFVVMAHVSLANNDYVELWLTTDTGDSLTIETGVLSAKVLG